MPWRIKSLESASTAGIISDGTVDLAFSSEALSGCTPAVGALVRVVLAAEKVLMVQPLEEPVRTGARRLRAGEQLSREEESALEVAIGRLPILSSPWRRVGNNAIGGLVAIGFSARHDLLLVSSGDGL
ncbi:MAG: hypothetical protein AAGA54_34695, partial [Myxococcota bacterium]